MWNRVKSELISKACLIVDADSVDWCVVSTCSGCGTGACHAEVGDNREVTHEITSLMRRRHRIFNGLISQMKRGI